MTQNEILEQAYEMAQRLGEGRHGGGYGASAYRRLLFKRAGLDPQSLSIVWWHLQKKMASAMSYMIDEFSKVEESLEIGPLLQLLTPLTNSLEEHYNAGN